MIVFFAHVFRSRMPVNTIIPKTQKEAPLIAAKTVGGRFVNSIRVGHQEMAVQNRMAFHTVIDNTSQRSKVTRNGRSDIF